MDIKLLKTDVLINNIPKFLIFAVYEQALCKHYLNSISNTLNLKYHFYDSADAAIYDITNNFKEPQIYIILDDPKVLKNPFYVTELLKLNKYIILYFNDLDKKSELYKNYSKYLVCFEKQDKYTLLAHLQKVCKANKISVDQDKLLKLIEYCDCNLGECENELDKIIILSQEKSNILMDYMLNNNFSDYRQTNVFKFINKILNKDKTAWEDKQNLVDTNMNVLYNLYNNAKQKFVATKKPYYLKLMKLSSWAFNSIVDGSMDESYSLNYVLYSAFRED